MTKTEFPLPLAQCECIWNSTFKSTSSWTRINDEEMSERFSFWLLVARSFANNKCQFSRKHESAIERLNIHWACATATYPLRSPHKWGKLNDGLLGFLNFSILLIALRLMSKIVGSQFHRLSQHASSINYLKSISFKCSRSKLLRKGYLQFGFVELIPCWEKNFL